MVRRRERNNLHAHALVVSMERKGKCSSVMATDVAMTMGLAMKVANTPDAMK